MSTAIVAGALATKAGNGGNAWTRIGLVRGLGRLGFDVVFVEELGGPTAEQRAYFDAVCSRFGVDGHLVSDSVPDELVDRADGAELLLNVGGHLTREPLRSAARVSVYLDDDPGYTQIWHAQGMLDGAVEAHDHHFTFGANVGSAECAIPADGVAWQPTRPVALLEEWPAFDGDSERFTTVGSWRGAYGRVEHEGHVYGQKAHEFRKLADLPSSTGRTFEAALAIDCADAEDAELLRRGGWRLVDPASVAGTPDEYRSYIQQSGVEVSAAQGIYVETRSGWFSDRTVQYLASGKPAIVQDTGLSDVLPTGDGLVLFRTPEEARRRVEEVAADYERHARAARVLAEEEFDSDRVLGGLLEQVL